jgi:hypothetical protein
MQFVMIEVMVQHSGEEVIFLSQIVVTKTQTVMQTFLILITAAANTRTVKIVTLPSAGRPMDTTSR